MQIETVQNRRLFQFKCAGYSDCGPTEALREGPFRGMLNLWTFDFFSLVVTMVADSRSAIQLERWMEKIISMPMREERKNRAR